MDCSSLLAKLSISFFSGKKNLRKVSVCYLFLILVCVFSSCEVGLGSAVDTQPPEITIEYPFVDSVIREEFIISGTCKDETSVNNVNVVFTNINDNSKRYEYIATVDNKTNSWHCWVNKQNSNGTYSIPDGSYEVSVTAIDNAKRTTTVNKTYKIDNTAPVLILQNPSTTIDSTSSNIFGQSLKVVGQLADTNNVDCLVFSVYDLNDKLIKQTKSFNVAQNMDVVLGTFNEKDSFYDLIYGNENVSTKEFRFKISVSDEARIYKGSEEKSLESERGNTTNGYYLRNDIYSPILTNYKISTQVLYSIFDGSYDGQINIEEVKNSLKQFFIDSNESQDIEGQIAKVKPFGTFALNPKNNPTYSVSALDPLDEACTWNDRSKTRNDSVVINALMGLGEAPLDVSSFCVKFYKLDVDGIKSAEEPLVIIKKEADCSEEEKAIRETLIKSVGDSYQITIRLEGIEDIKSNSRYEVVLEGIDKDGNEFDIDDTRYCFLVSAGSSVPSLEVSEPAKSVTYVKKEAAAHFEGIAESRSGGDNAYCTVYATINGKESDKINGKFNSDLDWTLDIPSEKFSQSISETYTVKIIARDENGLSVSKEFSVYYDVVNPEVEITISPTVEYEENTTVKIDGSDVNFEKAVTYVNGIISLKGTVTDDDAFGSGSCKILGELKDSVEIPEDWKKIITDDVVCGIETSITNMYKLSLDTNIFKDNQDVVVRIEAKDRAGLEAVKETSIKVNQYTDKPIITITSDIDVSVDSESKINSDKNLVDSRSNVISFTVNDDDGIQDIFVTLIAAPNGVALGKSASYAKDSKPTSQNVKYELPKVEGAYKLKITAKDKNDVSIQNESPEFFVAFDNDIPSLNITQIIPLTKKQDGSLQEENPINYYEGMFAPSLFRVKGTASDTSGIEGIYYLNGDTKTKVASGNNVLNFDWADNCVEETLGNNKRRTYFVKDKFGRETSVVIKYNVDTVNPKFNSNYIFVHGTNTLGKNPISISEAIKENTWFTNGTIKIEGKGTSSTETALEEENINTLSIKYGDNVSSINTAEFNKFTGTILFEDGQSQNVVLSAEDKAKNKSNLLNISLNIDSMIPEVSAAALNVNDSVTNADSVEITYSAQDATSGLAEVIVGTKAGFTSNVATKVVSGKTINSGTISVPTANLGKDGTYTLYIRVKDLAGNISVDKEAGTFTLDKTAPEVPVAKIVPSKGSRVNNTITISGTVMDNNFADVSVPVLWYKDSSTWKVVDGSAISNANRTDNEWNLEFDTTKIVPVVNGVVAKDIKFQVRFVDAAGNQTALLSDDAYSLIIDPDSDRPKIKFSEIKSKSGTIRKYATSISGIIDDDDGIQVVKIASTPKTLSQWQSYVQEGKVEISGTSFTYTPSDDKDGERQLYFYIKDNGGTEFYTDSENTLVQPYVQFVGNNNFVNNDEVISYKIDSNPPSIDLIVCGTGTTVNEAREDAKNKLAIKEEMGSATFVGGLKKYVVFGIKASDINGVNSITATNEKASNKTVNFAYDSTSNAYLSTTTVDASLYGTSAIIPETMNVTAKDNCELVTTRQKSITFCNVAPDVNVTYPTGDTVTGVVTVRGTTVPAVSGIEISSINYVVVNNAIKAKSDSDIISYIKAQSSSQTNNGSVTAWEFIFDGQDNELLPSTDGELVNYSNIPHTSDGIYSLPIYLLVTDELGNERLNKNHSIKYNPYSDRPTTEIVYPTVDVNSENAKLSGAIRVSGMALDNESVGKVFIQIDCNKDGVFDSSDINILSAMLDKDSNPIYQITRVSDIHGDITADPTFWGIEVKGTASWYYTINTYEELQNSYTKDTSKNLYNISIRVAAIDNNEKLGPWSAPLDLVIDPDAPTIGSSVSPYLENADGTSRINYEADMYLSGQWYLVTSVEDDNGISSVTYNQADDESRFASGNLISMSSSWTRTNLTYDSGTKGYTVKIPLNTTVGAGRTCVRINAKEDTDTALSASAIYSFNYDNTAPTINTVVQNGQIFENAAVLQNSNNKLTVGGTVTDANSGFERVIFYFSRRTKNSNQLRVYDPMINNSKEYVLKSDGTVENGIVRNNLGTNANPIYVYELKQNVTRPTETQLELTSENDHIREGGLVRIGGTYHRIDDVNGTTLSISPACNDTSDSVEEVYFPIAQVVDNTVAEQVKEFTAEGCIFTKGDDGDGMPESIVKTGVTWEWDATIHSNFIPDGPVEFTVIAFDKSGNVSAKEYSATIQNCRPRIAKLHLATDLTGDSKYSDNEFESYNILNVTGEGQYNYAFNTENYDNITRKAFTIKNKLAVIPEVVNGSGNGEISLVFNNSATNENPTTGSGSSLISTTESANISSINGNPYVLSNEVLVGSASPSESNDGNNKSMSFTFWDSTEELTQGQDTQYAVIRIKDFVVDITDGIVPNVKVNPFYWNDKNDNSLYNNSKENGHIELEKDLPSSKFNSASGVYDKDPKVSGKITFTGFAYDDVRISDLYFKFPGFTPSNNLGTSGTYYKFATYNSANGTWQKASATMASNSWEVSIDSTSEGTYFNQNGHKVKWTISIDTAKITNSAAADVSFALQVKDHKGNVSSSSTTGTDGTDSYNKPSYKVDVVPYIRNVTRNTSFNTNRSRSGAYPLARGETDNTLTGFNLGNTVTSVDDVNYGVNTTSDGSGTTVAFYDTQFKKDDELIEFDFRSGSVDGYLFVKVNGIMSLNNLNNNAAEYNKESVENVDSTQYWTDDRYVRVWQSKDADYFNGSDNGAYPTMDISDNGNLYATYIDNSASKIYYNKLGTNSKQQIYYSFDPAEETDICVTVDEDGNDKINVMYLANYFSTPNWYLSGGWTGGIYVYDNQGDQFYPGRYQEGSGTYMYAHRFELQAWNQNLYQFKNLRMARNDGKNAGYIHVAYYDKLTSSIHYSVIAGNHQTSQRVRYYDYSSCWVNIDGDFDNDDKTNYNGKTYLSADPIMGDEYTASMETDGASICLDDSRFINTSSGKRTNATGEYCDIALNNNGYPVIAYYDVNSTLRLAFASDSFPKGEGAASKWTVQDVMNVNDSNYNRPMACYIACEFDESGYLHIVFQNVKNQLIYLKSKSNGVSASGKYEFEDSVVLADYGMRMDMHIKGNTPYISYISSVNSADGLCLAFYDSTLDLDCDGNAEGGWEAMAAPLSRRVNDIRTSVAINPTPTSTKYTGISAYTGITCGWEAAIGYTPGDFYRVAFYIGTGNGH